MLCDIDCINCKFISSYIMSALSGEVMGRISSRQ